MNVLIFIFMLVLYPSYASANKITDIDNMFSKKTFYAEKSLDRIYFDDTGNFEQQINKKWGDIEEGSVLYGKWNRNNKDQLCLDYSHSFNKKSYYFLGKVFCYTVFEQRGRYRFFEDNKNLESYVFFRFSNLNTIFAPFMVKQLIEEIEEIEEIDYHSLKAYGPHVKKMIGMTFFINDSQYYFLDQYSAIEITKNKPYLIHTWKISDKYICIEGKRCSVIYFDNLLKESNDNLVMSFSNLDKFYTSIKGSFSYQSIVNHPDQIKIESFVKKLVN